MPGPSPPFLFVAASAFFEPDGLCAAIEHLAIFLWLDNNDGLLSDYYCLCLCFVEICSRGRAAWMECYC
ncbi:hypothetical protein U1Q18_014058, partial [Sarracenia purpurea var. burkii]